MMVLNPYTVPDMFALKQKNAAILESVWSEATPSGYSCTAFRLTRVRTMLAYERVIKYWSAGEQT